MFACLYSLSTPVAALVKLAEDFTPRFEVVGPLVARILERGRVVVPELRSHLQEQASGVGGQGGRERGVRSRHAGIIADHRGCAVRHSTRVTVTAVTSETSQTAGTGLLAGPERRQELVAASLTAPSWDLSAEQQDDLELLLTGKLVTAEKAAAQGLITAVVPAAEIRAYVAEVAGSLCNEASANSLKVTKKLIGTVLDLPLKEGLLQAATLNAQTREHDDCKRGITAFLNKEKLIW